MTEKIDKLSLEVSELKLNVKLESKDEIEVVNRDDLRALLDSHIVETQNQMISHDKQIA